MSELKLRRLLFVLKLCIREDKKTDLDSKVSDFSGFINGYFSRGLF